DPERTSEGRGGRRIGNQRLADVEAGGVVPEAEAGGDVSAREIVRRVVRGRVDEAADQNDEADLDRDAGDATPIPRPGLRFIGHRRARGKDGRTKSRLSGTAARIAGRPWSTAR